MKTALALCLCCIALLPCPAESGPSPSFSLGLEAGPLIGLDQAFRGLEAELLLGFEVEGLGAALALGLDWDRRLDSLAALLELGLSLGPGLSLFAGAELPFAPQAAETGGGARIGLEPASWPCRFGVSALLAELPGRRGRPGAALAAELSYAAYRVTGVESLEAGPAPPLEEATAGLAGFALGFRAELALRLLWPLGGGKAARGAKP